MTQTTHDEYLEELVNNLSEIGEDKQRIEWIMSDGIWMPDNSFEHRPFCDLILVYYDNYGIPVELKGSRKKRPKARLQLKSGKDFIEGVLRLDCPYGKFVTYAKNGYKSEKVGF